MASVLINSPILKEGLTLNWANNQVTVSPSDGRAQIEWDYLKFRGLYGKYGHSLDEKNCFFTDLVIAVAVVVGEGNYFLDEEGQQQLALEKQIEKENPIPEGAVS